MSEDEKCTKFLNIYFESINGKLENLKCTKVESDCHISFNVSNLELERAGSITLELFESESFCSEMNFKMQTSSSIPDEISSIISRIPRDGINYFKGPDPTVIGLLMTPSLFVAKTGFWQNEYQEQKGYHISQTTEVIKGSQMTYSEY